eukprot:2673556-Rhodomonas_salina.2
MQRYVTGMTARASRGQEGVGGSHPGSCANEPCCEAGIRKEAGCGCCRNEPGPAMGRCANESCRMAGNPGGVKPVSAKTARWLLGE